MELSGQHHISATFTPVRFTCTHQIGGRLGPRTVLDDLQKGAVSFPCRDFNPGPFSPYYSTHVLHAIKHNIFAWPVIQAQHTSLRIGCYKNCTRGDCGSNFGGDSRIPAKRLGVFIILLSPSK
jgi:hypothetical protein